MRDIARCHENDPGHRVSPCCVRELGNQGDRWEAYPQGAESSAPERLRESCERNIPLWRTAPLPEPTLGVGPVKPAWNGARAVLPPIPPEYVILTGALHADLGPWCGMLPESPRLPAHDQNMLKMLHTVVLPRTQNMNPQRHGTFRCLLL